MVERARQENTGAEVAGGIGVMPTRMEEKYHCIFKGVVGFGLIIN